MLHADTPAVILAPMDGLTDAPMRAVMGQFGAFTFAVSEFVRISGTVLPKSVFYRHIPELCQNAKTPSGLPVHVQLLGGDAGRLAESAAVACRAGAQVIDLNFGCPAPTVNTHDGGATLLKHPERIREIVAAVRSAIPREVPVSAKLRLGWDSLDAIHENAERAAEGGAAWLTIHGRTREQGYRPPAVWGPIRLVRERLGIPIVANGDIWSVAAFRQCREETGCCHFMLGRGALANPWLSHQIAHELGLPSAKCIPAPGTAFDWRPPLACLVRCADLYSDVVPGKSRGYLVSRLKQWLKIANLYGEFSAFDAIKRANSVDEIFTVLDQYDRAKRSGGDEYD